MVMRLLATLATLTLVVVSSAACGPGGGGADEGRTEGASPATAPPVTPAGATTVDLLQLPLLQGWPTQEELGDDGTVAGPVAGTKPIELTACGRTVRFVGPGRVGARLDSIEDYRRRAVASYGDETAATAAAGQVVGLFSRCPEEPQDALTEVHRVAGEPRSTRGAAITTSFRYDGAGALGSEAVVVLQRGRVVVLSAMSSEGMGQTRARSMAREQLRQLEPLLAELE